MRKIDEHTFKRVKKWLRIQPAKSVAKRFDLHESTVLNIRGSRNFNEYREMVKAEHPPIKFSLKEEVLSIHQQLFDKNDGRYIRPLTARTAVMHIRQHTKST